MGRKSSVKTPTVISGYLYTDDPETTGVKVDTSEWQAWLESNKTFYFQHDAGGFTARRQPHRRGWFWYAYKRIGGNLLKVYIGGPEKITLTRLTEVASQWPEAIKRQQDRQKGDKK